MKYSFIIPTKNEEKYVKGCIDSIKNQNITAEIIVVDGYSKDNTVSEAKNKGVRVLYESKKGPSAARNKGAKAATGDVLIFTDADVRFPPNFLEILENRNMPKGGCMFNLKFWDSGIIDNFAFTILNITIRLMSKFGATITNGSCLAFRKDIFEKVGGFKESLLTNEDHDIARKTSKIAEFRFCPIKIETSARRLKENSASTFLYMHYLNTKNYFLHKKSNPDYWD
jgi:glycosyltransferase involved in cell wall biosynthesis